MWKLPVLILTDFPLKERGRANIKGITETTPASFLAVLLPAI
jgi:hypothetical protein